MGKRYRDYGLPLILLAVCGLLLLVLLSEWVYYRGQRADLKRMLATPVVVQLKAPAVEQEHFALPGLQDYAATAERPLFMENRRPADADAEQPEPAHVEKTPLNIKLMGVASSPGQTVGLFVDAKGKYKRLHKNDSIGGWKVVELEPGKAIMDQDGTREELKVFNPKSKKKPEAPLQGFPPTGQFPGQPVPNTGFPPQPMPPPDTGNAGIPQPPMEAEQPNPNEAVDETPVPPQEPANDQ